MELQSLTPGRIYDFRIAGQPVGNGKTPVWRSRNRFVGYKTVDGASYLELLREGGSIALVQRESIVSVAPISAAEKVAMVMFLILALTLLAGLTRGMAEAGPSKPDVLTFASFFSMLALIVLTPIMIHREQKSRAVTFREGQDSQGERS